VQARLVALGLALRSGIQDAMAEIRGFAQGVISPLLVSGGSRAPSRTSPAESRPWSQPRYMSPNARPATSSRPPGTSPAKGSPTP
jgi:hypothetical protein